MLLPHCDICNKLIESGAHRIPLKVTLVYNGEKDRTHEYDVCSRCLPTMEKAIDRVLYGKNMKEG